MAVIDALRFAGGYTLPKPKSPERARPPQYRPPQYTPWYMRGGTKDPRRLVNTVRSIENFSAGAVNSLRDWFGTSRTRTLAPNKYANYAPPIPGYSPTQNIRPITPYANPQRGVPGYNVQGMYNTSGVRPQVNQLSTYRPTDYRNYAPPIPGYAPTNPGGMGFTPYPQRQPLPPLRGAGYDSGIDAGNIRPQAPPKGWSVRDTYLQSVQTGRLPAGYGPFPSGSTTQTVDPLPYDGGFGGYGGYRRGGGGGGGSSYSNAAGWYSTLVNWRI